MLLEEKLENKDYNLILDKKGFLTVKVGDVVRLRYIAVGYFNNVRKFEGLCVEKVLKGSNSYIRIRTVGRNVEVDIKFFMLSPSVRDVELVLKGNKNK